MVLGDRSVPRRHGSARAGGQEGASRTGRRGGHRVQARARWAGRSAGALWAATARRVMTRPLLFGCVAVGFMLTLAAPIRHLDVAIADDKVLPATAESHLVNDAMRNDFAICLPCQIPVVVPGVDAREPLFADLLADYARRLSMVPGVAQVDTASGGFVGGVQAGPAPTDGGGFLGIHGGAWLSLWPADPDPTSDA